MTHVEISTIVVLVAALCMGGVLGFWYSLLYEDGKRRTYQPFEPAPSVIDTHQSDDLDDPTGKVAATIGDVPYSESEIGWALAFAVIRNVENDMPVNASKNEIERVLFEYRDRVEKELLERLGVEGQTTSEWLHEWNFGKG